MMSSPGHSIDRIADALLTSAAWSEADIAVAIEQDQTLPRINLSVMQQLGDQIALLDSDWQSLDAGRASEVTKSPEDKDLLIRLLDQAWALTERRPDLVIDVKMHAFALHVQSDASNFEETVRLTVKPRWKLRQTRREVSPHDFIGEHYARFVDDPRFTREVLQAIDPPLCIAYDTWRSRHSKVKAYIQKPYGNRAFQRPRKLKS